MPCQTRAVGIMSFTEAIEDSESIRGLRHLLLGNGFSIACRPDAFRYARLVDEADFSRLNVAAEALFDLSGTADFERVIESLRVSEAVLPLYGPSESDVLDRIRQDAESLKEALAEVLSRKHPGNVGEIELGEYASARDFLRHFDGKVYTVNYDLLLYWTLLQDLEPHIDHNDGFREDPDDPDAEWVTWDGYVASNYQRVYHLHGGLHLYDAGASLTKLTWARTGVALIDQIRKALNSATYPLIVTEGSSLEKLRRIEHSPYLHRGLRSLAACGGCLFMYGHSLDANDDHVLRRIEQGKVETVYVSLYGDPESDDNRAIQQRAALMADRRDESEAHKTAGRRRPIRVEFYDAESAAIWNE